MTKEKDLSLNLVNLAQTRSWILIFLCCSSLVFGANNVWQIVDDAKSLKKLNDRNGNKKEFIADRTKSILGESLITLVAVAAAVVFYRGLAAMKRQNDAAAARITHRYLKQIRNQYPELKQYDAVLNNDMALHNIAAGLASKLPVKQVLELGYLWEWTRSKSTKYGCASIDELKAINCSIDMVINELKRYSELHPDFIPYLEKLLEHGTKSFFVPQKTTNSKVR